MVDDYQVVVGYKRAVHDFLPERNMSPAIEEIDGVGVYLKV